MLFDVPATDYKQLIKKIDAGAACSRRKMVRTACMVAAVVAEGWYHACLQQACMVQHGMHGCTTKNRCVVMIVRRHQSKL